MKKHDEGYALVLVLVVMIVLSLVAATVLTFSLRNLQNQQKSIQRMEDKYAAQGIIESCVQKAKTAWQFTAISETGLSVTPVTPVDETSSSISATIIANSGTATINCTVTITKKTENETEVCIITYDTYEITYQEVSE